MNIGFGLQDVSPYKSDVDRPWRPCVATVVGDRTACPALARGPTIHGRHNNQQLTGKCSAQANRIAMKPVSPSPLSASQQGLKFVCCNETGQHFPAQRLESNRPIGRQNGMVLPSALPANTVHRPPRRP